MPFDFSVGPVKPARWDWNPRYLSSEAQAVAQKLVAAFPMWEQGGELHSAGGERRITGTTTDAVRASNLRGTGVSFDNTATGDGVRLDDTLEDWIDVSQAGQTFSVVVCATAVQWNQFGVSKYFFGARNSSGQGWAGRVDGSGVLFTLNGVADYTLFSVGTDVGEYKTIGFNVDIDNEAEGFENGVAQGGVAIGTGTKSGVNFALWSFWDGVQSRLEDEWNGVGNAIYFFQPALTAAEQAFLGRDPFALLRPDPSRLMPLFFTEGADAGGTAVPVFLHHLRQQGIA